MITRSQSTCSCPRCRVWEVSSKLDFTPNSLTKLFGFKDIAELIHAVDVGHELFKALEGANGYALLKAMRARRR